MADFFIKTIPLPVPRPAEADTLPIRVYETITEQFDIFSHKTAGLDLIKEKIMNAYTNIFDFAEKLSTGLEWGLTYAVIGVCLGLPLFLIGYVISKIVKKICGN